MYQKIIIRIVFGVLALFSFSVTAQEKYVLKKPLSDDQKEVFNVIITLFDGMRAGDSAQVHSTFRKDANMFTSYTNENGTPQLRKGDLQSFLKAVGTPHDITWDEPIWNTHIEISDNLAMVWTDYAFYAGKTFSHCGVDAFLLNKSLDGWKIFHLTDTRKKEGCDVPKDIREGRDRNE